MRATLPARRFFAASPRLLLLLLFPLPALPPGAAAAVTLAPLFTDHAVLQADKPVPVWGAADPGQAVTVTYLDQRKSAVGGPDGRWQVTLDPMPPGKNGELAAAGSSPGSGSDAVRRSDVATGLVWLCSGQSNMALQLKNTGATAEMAGAALPAVRFFIVPIRSAPEPQATVAGRWVPCTPQSAGDFSAVAYYFAKSLQQATGMPVGILSSSKGATPVEAWMSHEALAASGKLDLVQSRWDALLKAYPEKKAEYDRTTLVAWQQARDAAQAAGQPLPPQPSAPPGPGDFRTPAGLYNGMIHPLLPYALEGFAWYQGEANAALSQEYPALCGAMIADWRSRFGQGNLPFLFVQLPNLKLPDRQDKDGMMWARMRAAQARLLTLPRTAMAVTIDVGDPDNVHPKNKAPVGQRLALLARTLVHGESVVATGPVFQVASPEGDTLRLVFDSAAGLTTRDGQPPAGFEVSGADGAFVAAQGRIDGETVTVSNPAVPHPQLVRYAWKSNPAEANLANGAGLPAAPFFWPPPTVDPTATP